jgi:hypothetical protein
MIKFFNPLNTKMKNLSLHFSPIPEKALFSIFLGFAHLSSWQY